MTSFQLTSFFFSLPPRKRERTITLSRFKLLPWIFRRQFGTFTIPKSLGLHPNGIEPLDSIWKFFPFPTIDIFNLAFSFWIKQSQRVTRFNPTGVVCHKRFNTIDQLKQNHETIQLRNLVIFYWINKCTTKWLFFPLFSLKENELSKQVLNKFLMIHLIITRNFSSS